MKTMKTKTNKTNKTTKPTFQACCLVGAMLLALAAVPALGQNASAALYKSKCVSCHAADGTGSATGKKLGTHDFQSDEVQKMSDADLTAAITTGKKKMPPYGKSLKAEDIAGLVAYLRNLKK
jgi:cytochrome c6